LSITEKHIKNLEKIEEIMKESLDNLTEFILINAIWIDHDLTEITPGFNVQFIFNNWSVYDVRFIHFSYTPSLVGLSGSRLRQTDRIVNKIIPHHKRIYVDESFLITDGIRKKLLLWRSKSETEVNFHLEVRWQLSIDATILHDEEELIIKRNIEARKWAYNL